MYMCASTHMKGGFYRLFILDVSDVAVYTSVFYSVCIFLRDKMLALPVGKIIPQEWLLQFWGEAVSLGAGEPLDATEKTTDMRNT